jgi:hypothetical protein
MKSSARLSSRGVRRCADLRDVCIAIAAAARLMADSPTRSNSTCSICSDGSATAETTEGVARQVRSRAATFCSSRDGKPGAQGPPRLPFCAALRTEGASRAAQRPSAKRFEVRTGRGLNINPRRAAARTSHSKPRAIRYRPLRKTRSRLSPARRARSPAVAEGCAILSEAREVLSIETAPVHHAARRRGGRVAARGAHAAAGSDAAYRRADGWCGERSG